MAKDKEQEIINAVKAVPTTNDLIGRMVQDQNESFPSLSEISIDEPYVDPFEVPKWCDQVNFAFAWIDPKDDIQRHRAMDVGHFRIVTRTSSCIISKNLVQRDFRDHGAVERQGMILVFRPKDIDDRLRTFPVRAHVEMTSTLAAGKQEEGFEVTHTKYKAGDHSPAEKDDRGAKVEVVAFEEAGSEGIKQVGG